MPGPGAGETRIARATRSVDHTTSALVAATFAAQSSGFVLPPLLPELATIFDASVASVGQLRAVSALAATMAPVVLIGRVRRWGPRRLITGGLALVVAGSVLAALAWDLGVLVAAHVFLGLGLGIVVSSCLSASAVWAPPSDRARLLSWTMMGPAAAAVVATPVAGALVLLSWRAAWLLPAFAAVLALVLVRDRPADAPAPHPGAADRLPAWRIPGVAAWCAGELLAYAGWSVVTLYAAALLIQSYGASPLLAAVVVSASASAFMVGNRLTRGRLGDPRPTLLATALALAVSGGAFGWLRPGFATSACLLVLLGLLNGGRSPAGSALGLQLAPRRTELMAARTSAQSLGYLTGAAVGGLVLSRLGYHALGTLMAALFCLAALPHLHALRSPSRPAGTTRS